VDHDGLLAAWCPAEADALDAIDGQQVGGAAAQDPLGGRRRILGHGRNPSRFARFSSRGSAVT
jgi:hypothetical protein